MDVVMVVVKIVICVTSVRGWLLMPRNDRQRDD